MRRMIDIGKPNLTPREKKVVNEFAGEDYEVAIETRIVYWEMILCNIQKLL